MLLGLLTDRYELPLSTASSAARDAYVEGCEAKLTMYPGAIEGFDRAIAADPGFALAHAARAHVLLERGDAAAARASVAAADSLAPGLAPRPARRGAVLAGARRRGGGPRVDAGAQFPRRRSVRAGSQPYRVFRF